MSNLSELKDCIAQAKNHMDYMLEDATNGEAQAFMESAEEAQRQIMRAVTRVFIASQRRSIE